jgi:hypothetical protein
MKSLVESELIFHFRVFFTDFCLIGISLRVAHLFIVKLVCTNDLALMLSQSAVNFAYFVLQKHLMANAQFYKFCDISS